MEQEKLEEAAERYSFDHFEKLDFINGAKWQQEKIIKELELRKKKEMNSFFREFYTSTIKLIKEDGKQG
jgi:hypothetical protein